MTSTLTLADELLALAGKATPGPWKSRGLGGDSIILCQTHRWHKPYIIPDHGYPLALPRTYEEVLEPGGPSKTQVDFSSAGFAHDDAAYIAKADPTNITALCNAVKELSAVNARLREALTDFVAAVTTEVNEKGSGGYLLARLSDAKSVLAAGKQL